MKHRLDKEHVIGNFPWFLVPTIKAGVRMKWGYKLQSEESYAKGKGYLRVYKRGPIAKDKVSQVRAYIMGITYAMEHGVVIDPIND